MKIISVHMEIDRSNVMERDFLHYYTKATNLFKTPNSSTILFVSKILNAQDAIIQCTKKQD